MPIGEDDIMFEESWTSPTVLLDNATTSINEADLDEKASPLSTTSTVFTDAAKLQCPICRRILPSKEFGQCIGAPTSEFPVLRDQNGMTSRKRKRTESRTAHETRSAPCHDCLDNLGEEEGETWGRCDNPNCWSRGDQAKLRMSGPFADEDDYPFFGRSMLRPTPSSFVLRPRPQPDRPANPNKHKLGLVCPQCSPEGGLGCSHKWICDVCAFWEKQPLVWECPGCLNDYCDECEEVCFGGLDEEERCFECGKRDLCRGCRENFLSGSPSSERGLHDFGLSEQIFSWRCQLCNFPVCNSCLPSALANRRIDSCRNCCSHLCGTCRSLLACQRCGGEMCQLCLGESLAMLCRKCEHGD